MEVSSSHQITVFFLYVLSGFVCGTFFDVQRVLRRMLAADAARTFIEDFAFAVFTVFMTIAPGFVHNNGEMRYYQIIGLLCGGIVYAMVLSPVVRKILYFIFGLVCKMIVIPTMKICRAFFFPFKMLKGKIKEFKTFKTRAKNKLSRHLKRKRKTIKKRIKML